MHEPTREASRVIVKEGWLLGRCPGLGRENATLKRRYFVLEPNRMRWYDEAADGEVVGEMVLDVKTVLITDSIAKGQCCVQTSDAHAKLVLKSASPAEMKQWAEMLAAQIEGQQASLEERTRTLGVGNGRASGAEEPQQLTGWNKFSPGELTPRGSKVEEAPPGGADDEPEEQLGLGPRLLAGASGSGAAEPGAPRAAPAHSSPPPLMTLTLALSPAAWLQRARWCSPAAWAAWGWGSTTRTA